MLKSYLINENTMAILPEFKVSGAKAQIIEVNKTFFATISPYQVIKESLLCYGTNIKGTRASSLYHLGNINRPPITVSDVCNIYLYPSGALDNIENCWFSVTHTLDFEKNADYTAIVFNNFVKVAVKVKLQTLKNSYHRGLELKQKKDLLFKSEYPLNAWKKQSRDIG